MTRVLIVDDEPSMCQIVSSLLRFEGFEVQTAPNGLVALRRVREVAPDVVVSDINMPQLNGFELVQAIRADPALAHIRIVLVTGATDDDAVTVQALSQADACVTKPFTRDQLLGTLRSIGY